MICTKSTFENLRSILEEYGGMDVPEDPKDPDELTWADVCRTVGPDGSYVRVVLINSIFGGGGTGFSFLYANGKSTYPGYMSDAWDTSIVTSILKRGRNLVMRPKCLLF